MPSREEEQYLALRKDALAQRVLAKFTAELGGRTGLNDMKAIFDEMDIDASGALSHNEFRRGLKQHGMSLEDNEVSALLKLLDINNDGMLQFEEFEMIAKAEMECVELEGMWTEEIRKTPQLEFRRLSVEQMKDKALAAAHRGTRFTRTMSVSGDVKRQGSAEMLSVEALEARKEIKKVRC
jgi:hypothetical protein